MNGKDHNRFNSTLVLGLIGLLATMACGGTEAIQQKLKPEVSIKLENVTIAEALERISEQAGIRIALSEAAIWKLPEGKDTRISATLEGSLGGSLDQMLNDLFLRYSIGSEPLMIYPRPELRHILGRPTARSLKLLKNIYTQQASINADNWNIAFAPMNYSFVQKTLDTLAGEPVTVVPMRQFEAVVNTVGGMALRGDSSEKDRPAPGMIVTLASILDDTAGSLDGPHEWFISIPDLPNQVPQIRIEKRSEFAKARLEQVADVSFENEEGRKVIQSLVTRVDMTLMVMQEAVRRMGMKVSLDAQNVTLEMALQKALKALGIRWTVHLDLDRIELTGVEPSANEYTGPTEEMPVPPKPAEDAYVGKISIPMEGGRYFIEFMLRESDLTDELRKLRAEKIREILKASSPADVNETRRQGNR